MNGALCFSQTTRAAKGNTSPNTQAPPSFSRGLPSSAKSKLPAPLKSSARKNPPPTSTAVQEGAASALGSRTKALKFPHASIFWTETKNLGGALPAAPSPAPTSGADSASSPKPSNSGKAATIDSTTASDMQKKTARGSTCGYRLKRFQVKLRLKKFQLQTVDQINMKSITR